jgi:hypothetical protein
MFVPLGNDGAGVQVKTVLPELHTVPGCGTIGPALFEKITEVAAVYIAVLNVNTTGLLGDTPVAPLTGLTDRIVGCARSWLSPARVRINKRPETNRPWRRKAWLIVIKVLLLISVGTRPV